MTSSNHIDIFVNNFLRTFRRYSQETFYVKIDGLKPFANEDRNGTYLIIEELRKNGFYIELTGDKESMDELHVSFSNSLDEVETAFSLNPIGGGRP